MDFTPETMRARFAELADQSTSMHAAVDPLRDELAKLVAGDTDLSARDAKAREAVVRATIVAANDAIYPIEQERAMIARALGGKTGAPEAAADDAAVS